MVLLFRSIQAIYARENGVGTVFESGKVYIPDNLANFFKDDLNTVVGG
ncbi:hypothetical protein [Candidatus Photodesmus blepharus]